MRPMNRRAGLTLLEVLIASLIFSAVVLMAFASLMSTSTAANRGSAASEVEQRGLRFLGFCRDDFAVAQFSKTIDFGSGGWALGLPSGTFNTAIAYRIPGVRNASGAPIAAGGMVFGYASPLPAPNTGFYQDLACVVRFEADTVLKESSSSPDAAQAADWGSPFPAYPALVNPSSSMLPSQILGMDLNQDGDRSDTFVSGKIMKYVLAPAASPLGTAHAAFAIFGVTQSKLLLSREALSDDVLLRIASPAAGNFLSDFEGQASSPASALEGLFRFVDATGSPDGTPVDNSNIALDGRGVLIVVVHGKPDSTGKGYLVRKNSLLVRFAAAQ